MTALLTSVAQSPFSSTLPTFQVAWDATSLSWLRKCPKLYFYQMIEGWSSRHRGIHLTFGLLYAAALERYAHSRAKGIDHDTSVRTMVRWALENSGERPHDTIDTMDGEEVVQSVCIHCDRINDISGRRELDLDNGQCPNGPFVAWDPSPDPDANVKNRFTLIRTLVWNVDERRDSPFTTLILANGRPAVELSFKMEAGYSFGPDNILLSGHLDEVVEADGQVWIRDDKTTKNALGASYFHQYSPNTQMSLYTIAGKVIFDKRIRGVLVKAAQIGVGFSRFQTAQIPRPQAVLDEWMEDTRFWIGQAHAFAEANHWPQNDSACFLCGFKKICSVSPSHRQAHLEADFVKREPWNPLSARGDV